MHAGNPICIPFFATEDPFLSAPEQLAERRRVRTMVDSGLYEQHEVLGYIGSLPFDAHTRQMLCTEALEEVQGLERKQEDGERDDDCARLDAVFVELNALGICAVANAGTRGSEALANVVKRISDSAPGGYIGYCYYHLEDIAWCLAGRGLMISFGSLAGHPHVNSAVAQQILHALKAANLVASHPLDGEQIWLRGFQWQRGRPPR